MIGVRKVLFEIGIWLIKTFGPAVDIWYRELVIVNLNKYPNNEKWQNFCINFWVQKKQIDVYRNGKKRKLVAIPDVNPVTEVSLWSRRLSKKEIQLLWGLK